MLVPKEIIWTGYMIAMGSVTYTDLESCSGWASGRKESGVGGFITQGDVEFEEEVVLDSLRVNCSQAKHVAKNMSISGRCKGHVKNSSIEGSLTIVGNDRLYAAELKCENLKMEGSISCHYMKGEISQCQILKGSIAAAESDIRISRCRLSSIGLDTSNVRLTSIICKHLELTSSAVRAWKLTVRGSANLIKASSLVIQKGFVKKSVTVDSTSMIDAYSVVFGDVIKNDGVIFSHQCEFDSYVRVTGAHYSHGDWGAFLIYPVKDKHSSSTKYVAGKDLCITAGVKETMNATEGVWYGSKNPMRVFPWWKYHQVKNQNCGW